MTAQDRIESVDRLEVHLQANGWENIRRGSRATILLAEWGGWRLQTEGLADSLRVSLYIPGAIHFQVDGADATEAFYAAVEKACRDLDSMRAIRIQRKACQEPTLKV